MRARLDGVLVDLDDTLIASARAARRGRRTLREFGVRPRAFIAADTRWWHRYVAGEVDIEGLRAGRWRDLGLEGDAARRADEAYRSASRLVHLRRGAKRLLRGLREAGLRVAILTNGSVDPQWQKIERVGLTDLVDAVVVTEAVGFHKPDRRAFEAALGKLEVGPGAAAMVGDTLDTDINGAVELGFQRVVWLSRADVPPHPGVVVARTLEAVLPALTG